MANSLYKNPDNMNPQGTRKNPQETQKTLQPGSVFALFIGRESNDRSALSSCVCGWSSWFLLSSVIGSPGPASNGAVVGLKLSPRLKRYS
jgi:hypothetical protein